MHYNNQPCETFGELAASSLIDRAAIVARRDLNEIIGNQPTEEILGNITTFREVIKALNTADHASTLEEALPDMEPSQRRALIANAEKLVMTHQVETTLAKDDYSTIELAKCLHAVLGLTNISAEEIAKMEAMKAKLTPDLNEGLSDTYRGGRNPVDFFESIGGVEFAISYLAASYIEEGCCGPNNDWEVLLDAAYGQNPDYQEMKAICEKYLALKGLTADLEHNFTPNLLTHTQGRIDLGQFEKYLSPDQLSKLQAISEHLLQQNYVFTPRAEFPVIQTLEDGRRKYTSTEQPKWQKAKVS